MMAAAGPSVAQTSARPAAISSFQHRGLLELYERGWKRGVADQFNEYCLAVLDGLDVLAFDDLPPPGLAGERRTDGRCVVPLVGRFHLSYSWTSRGKEALDLHSSTVQLVNVADWMTPERPARQRTSVGRFLRLLVLPAMNITPTGFARRLGIHRASAHRLFAGETGLSEAMAERMEALTGAAASFWFRLQRQHQAGSVA